jgi:hypothetical protein
MPMRIPIIWRLDPSALVAALQEWCRAILVHSHSLPASLERFASRNAARRPLVNNRAKYTNPTASKSVSLQKTFLAD